MFVVFVVLSLCVCVCVSVCVCVCDRAVVRPGQCSQIVEKLNKIEKTRGKCVHECS